MRRMATNKQLDYINDLQEVAEKGFKVGTYPAEIEIIHEGEFDWDVIIEQVENEDINFSTHQFSSGLRFNCPKLFEHYGLGHNNNPGYIQYELNEYSITMPNSVVDFNSLKAWMLSEDFIDAIDEVGYSFGTTYLSSNVADYEGDDPGNNIELYNGELRLNTYITCVEGEGEEIVGASDPVGEPTLDVKNLEVENITSDNIKPWYFLTGMFTDDDNTMYIFSNGPVTYVNNKNQYSGFAMFVNSDNQLDSISVWADFEQQKLFRNGITEISLNSGSVELINALTGEIEKIFEV